jgi:hypothetical protein
MRIALACLAALASAACVHVSVTEDGKTVTSDCPAWKPAYEVTDEFMRTFNARDMAAHEKTYHFPHVRIASGNVTVIPQAGTERDTFPRLIATGWDHSAWADRRIVQCQATKAHMLTTFIRYRADGSELSRFDSLYIVEFKGGTWGITGRSSFAP